MLHDNAYAIADEQVDYLATAYTAPDLQLVYMRLNAGETIPREVHKVTQLLHVIAGEGTLLINRKTHNLKPHDVVVIDAGQSHEIRAGLRPLVLYSVYAGKVHGEHELIHRQ